MYKMTLFLFQNRKIMPQFFFYHSEDITMTGTQELTKTFYMIMLYIFPDVCYASISHVSTTPRDVDNLVLPRSYLHSGVKMSQPLYKQCHWFEPLWQVISAEPTIAVA